MKPSAVFPSANIRRSNKSLAFIHFALADRSFAKAERPSGSKINLTKHGIKVYFVSLQGKIKPDTMLQFQGHDYHTSFTNSHLPSKIFIGLEHYINHAGASSPSGQERAIKEYLASPEDTSVLIFDSRNSINYGNRTITPQLVDSEGNAYELKSPFKQISFFNIKHVLSLVGKNDQVGLDELISKIYTTPESRESPFSIIDILLIFVFVWSIFFLLLSFRRSEEYGGFSPK